VCRDQGSCSLLKIQGRCLLFQFYDHFGGCEFLQVWACLLSSFCRPSIDRNGLFERLSLVRTPLVPRRLALGASAVRRFFSTFLPMPKRRIDCFFVVVATLGGFFVVFHARGWGGGVGPWALLGLSPIVFFRLLFLSISRNDPISLLLPCVVSLD